MERTITVKGHGKISCVVDQADLYVTISGRDPGCEAASSLAAERLSLLEQAAEGCGFHKKQLITTSYQLQTEYEGWQDETGVYRNRISGFVCRHELRLSLPFDSALLSRILTAIAQSGAEAELRLEFTVADKDAAKEALLAQAVITANAEAEVLCRAAGVKLGDLLHMEYGVQAPEILSPTRLEATGAALMSKRTALPELSPEDIILEDDVTLTWAIG